MSKNEGDDQSGKLPGKTEWAGRRRPVTRRVDYAAKASIEIDYMVTQSVVLASGDVLQIRVDVPGIQDGQWFGFGGWYSIHGEVNVEFVFPYKYSRTNYSGEVWNKFGSLLSGPYDAAEFLIKVHALKNTEVFLYGVSAGWVEHDYLTDARPELLRNMFQFAPEANFYRESLGALCPDPIHWSTDFEDLVVASQN